LIDSQEEDFLGEEYFKLLMQVVQISESVKELTVAENGIFTM